MFQRELFPGAEEGYWEEIVRIGKKKQQTNQQTKTKKLDWKQRNLYKGLGRKLKKYISIIKEIHNIG